MPKVSSGSPVYSIYIINILSRPGFTVCKRRKIDKARVFIWLSFYYIFLQKCQRSFGLPYFVSRAIMFSFYCEFTITLQFKSNLMFTLSIQNICMYNIVQNFHQLSDLFHNALGYNLVTVD